METRFVGTPWRGRRELLELRAALYGGDGAARREAVNTILAWRVRKLELPLLLESTADLVDAELQDETGSLQMHALRMVYATAVSRFITGLADTQAELTRDRPAWFLPNQTLQLPLTLRETRHRIVHRHLPSLAELKRAARESLDWLWEWYWSHLDAAFGGRDRLSEREVRERLQAVLKSYVKDRKAEIKRRGKADTKAAESAAASYLFLDGPQASKQAVLLNLLVDEKAMLPADKRLGSSMSGAFLIWNPFLLALCKTSPSFLHALLEHVVEVLGATAMGTISVESEPTRQGLYEWCTHVLASGEWKEMRERIQTQSETAAKSRLVEQVLALCFTTPTYWPLKLADILLEQKSLAGRNAWLAVLEAARSEDVVVDVDMDVDMDESAPAIPFSAKNRVKEVAMTKIRGPQKRVGLWKPLPIGTLVGGD